MPRLSNPSDSRIWCRVLNRTIGPRGSVWITEDEAQIIRSIHALVLEPDPVASPGRRVYVRRGMALVEASSAPEVEQR